MTYKSYKTYKKTIIIYDETKNHDPLHSSADGGARVLRSDPDGARREHCARQQLECCNIL